MHTTPLLLEACKDLKVLGMWTMKKLLQWQARAGAASERWGGGRWGGGVFPNWGGPQV